MTEVDRSLVRYWEFMTSAGGCRAHAGEYDARTRDILLRFAETQEERANALLGGVERLSTAGAA